ILDEKIVKKKILVEKNIVDWIVRVDRSAFISQVILNILSNAVKFSYEGGLISIRGYSRDNCYHLEVKDSGTGMSAETLENIFADYVITTTPGTQGEKGTGFGMPIAHQVMKRLGGELQVTSSLAEADRGTTVKIILKGV
ncbi:MAG: ATP-binding protein, partial [Proteobacteria bacterium]|nr:ATP-binding protein [Pseudomonadota bacterium]